MTKVSDSYETVVRGVSQQPPDKRQEGQVWVQDNMISDPVRGLRRRPGSRRLSERVLAGDHADLAENFRAFDIQADGRELTLVTRRPGTTGASDSVYAIQRGELDGVLDATILTVHTSTAAQALLADGVNAAVAVGKFLILAHNTPVGVSRTELYDSDENRQRVVVSIKGATYSRQYRIKLKRASSALVNIQYTTPNIYDASGAVVASAAAATQPYQIAAELRTRLLANGTFAANYTIVREEASLIITPNGPDLEYVTVSDGGDGSLVNAAWRVVENPGELPAAGIPGHIVKVAPSADTAYYLRAEADLDEPEKVVWREYTAAEVNIVDPFVIGVAVGEDVYLGANPQDLQVLLDAETIDIEVPEIPGRVAGDDDSSPVVHFAERVITDLAVFQERLLVMSGPVVNASQIGNFFNFWRSTVLTYPDDDPVEAYATGAEADVIRGSVIFDRSLILVGDKQQYAIGGKVPLTGSTSTIMQSSAHKDAATVRPVALGDLMFFLKAGRQYVTAYQIAVGSVEDTSNSSELSRQLSDYLLGVGRELVGISQPEMLLIRTSVPNTMYSFAFIDTPDGGRLMDAWSKWTFSDLVGSLAAISSYRDRPRPIFVRPATEGNVLLVVDEIDLNSTENIYPHLDSWFYDPDAFDRTGGLATAYTGEAEANQQWYGREDDDVAALITEFGESEHIVLGFLQPPAAVEFTSPYTKNRDGRIQLGGVLTVTTIDLGVVESGACDVEILTDWGNYVAINWNGRIIGRANNLVGYRQLYDDTIRFMVAQVNTQYRARVTARDWRPLTITSLAWTGQYFKRSRSL